MFDIHSKVNYFLQIKIINLISNDKIQQVANIQYIPHCRKLN